MIKCPNCGSTAQVKEDLFWRKMFDNTVHHYNCGCGCTFNIRTTLTGRIHGEWFMEGENVDDTKITNLFQP